MPKSIKIPYDAKSTKAEYLYLTLESSTGLTVAVRGFFGKPKRQDKFLQSLMTQNTIFTGNKVKEIVSDAL